MQSIEKLVESLSKGDKLTLEITRNDNGKLTVKASLDFKAEETAVEALFPVAAPQPAQKPAAPAPVEKPAPAPAPKPAAPVAEKEQDLPDPRELYKEGMVFYKAGNYSDAYKKFETALAFATQVQKEVIEKSMASCRKKMHESLFGEETASEQA